MKEGGELGWIGPAHHDPPEQQQRDACTEHPARQITPAVAEAHPASDEDQNEPEAEQQGADGSEGRLHQGFHSCARRGSVTWLAAALLSACAMR